MGTGSTYVKLPASLCSSLSTILMPNSPSSSSLSDPSWCGGTGKGSFAFEEAADVSDVRTDASMIPGERCRSFGRGLEAANKGAVGPTRDTGVGTVCARKSGGCLCTTGAGVGPPSGPDPDNGSPSPLTVAVAALTTVPRCFEPIAGTDTSLTAWGISGIETEPPPTPGRPCGASSKLNISNSINLPPPSSLTTTNCSSSGSTTPATTSNPHLSSTTPIIRGYPKCPSTTPLKSTFHTPSTGSSPATPSCADAALYISPNTPSPSS